MSLRVHKFGKKIMCQVQLWSQSVLKKRKMYRYSLETYLNIPLNEAQSPITISQYVQYVSLALFFPLTGLLEKEDLGTRISKLSSRIDETKAEVYNVVQDKYVDFKPSLNRTVDLHGKVDVLATETQALGNKIKVNCGYKCFNCYHQCLIYPSLKWNSGRWDLWISRLKVRFEWKLFSKIYIREDQRILFCVMKNNKIMCIRSRNMV